MHWIWHLILGGVAGWLAGKVMRGEGYGVFVDVIVGLIGGWLGGKIGELIGFHLGGSTVGYLITAFVGAVILVWIVRMVKKVL